MSRILLPMLCALALLSVDAGAQEPAAEAPAEPTPDASAEDAQPAAEEPAAEEPAAEEPAAEEDGAPEEVNRETLRDALRPAEGGAAEPAPEADEAGPGDVDRETLRDALRPDEGASAPAEPTAAEGEPAAPERFVAAAPAEVSGTVGAVRVKGLKRVEEAAILAAIGLRTNEPLEGWKLRRDIKAVYGTGFVDDVRVDVGGPRASRDVVFIVDEKPAIRDVFLKGNKKLGEDAIMEVVDITPFSVLNEAELKRNVSRIRDKYIEKGFYLVQIDPQLKEVGDELVELTFEITENRKVLVQQIDITGNAGAPECQPGGRARGATGNSACVTDRKIRRYLQTKQAGILPWLGSGGAFNEQALLDDLQIIKSVFLEEGYVDVAVDPPQVYLSPDKRFIYISINVEEGTRYKLGKIKVQGDFVEEEGLTRDAVRKVIEGETAKVMSDRWRRARRKAEADNGEGALPKPGWEGTQAAPLSFEPKHPELETGDWFRLTILQGTLAEISDLYGDQGYAFANVVPMTETDEESGVVDITFDIQRGEKVSIRRIDITGNDPTWDKVVRREIPINEGDIYSGSQLKEARQRLERLGFFEEVRISTPRAAEPDELDMKVEVTEQPTGSFSVGAGFSNIENFMLNLNVSKNNFLGLGYVMSAAANVSSQRQQWQLQLFDPYFLDSRWTLRLDGYSINRQFIEDEYQRGFSMSVGRYLDPRDDVRMTFDYSFEDTGLNSLDAYKERILGGQLYRNGLTSTGGLGLIVDKRNNRIQATRGIFTTASMALSGGFRTDEEQIVNIFGGEFNFLEGKINLRAYQPVIPRKEWLVFKYNSTLGSIWSTDGTVVPFIHRYRAGGINSVRGYNWFSLGPGIRAAGYNPGSGGNNSTIFVGSDDPLAAEDRLVVGGTQTWINNFELEAAIIPQAGISVVTFFDAGNAFGDPWGEGRINPAGLRLSYGAGVRWFSPMGPLRFEWGFPVNPRPDERRAVFDFSIGSLF